MMVIIIFELQNGEFHYFFLLCSQLMRTYNKEDKHEDGA
jgi:hypothetical protein